MPAASADPTVLDYLRHGTPIGGSRYRGHAIDDALSDQGWQQMRNTTAALGDWQRIVSSPLQRCSAFAEWLGGQLAVPVDIVTDLREVGFGTWEGKTREELKRERADEYHAFYADPVHNRPHDAEPLDRFGARVAAVFDGLVERFSGQHVLVVCHAGVVRGTLGHVIRAPAENWYRAAVDHAALTRFAHDHHGPRLVAHNWRPAL